MFHIPPCTTDLTDEHALSSLGRAQPLLPPRFLFLQQLGKRRISSLLFLLPRNSSCMTVTYNKKIYQIHHSTLYSWTSMQLCLKTCRIQTHKWCSADTYSSAPDLSLKLKQPFAQRGKLYTGKGRYMGIITICWKGKVYGYHCYWCSSCKVTGDVGCLSSGTTNMPGLQGTLQNTEYLMFWVVGLYKGAQEEAPENQWSGSQYYCRFLFLGWFWECLFYCVWEIQSFLILDPTI